MAIIKRHFSFNNKKGASTIEYALVVTIVALVVTFAITGVGNQVIDLFERIASFIGNIVSS